MKNLFFLNVTPDEQKLPYYIYGASSNYTQSKVFRPNGCTWYQLNICRKGRGILKMNGKERYIEEGDSIIIYPNIPHEYYPITDKMVVSWVAFDGFQVNSMFKFIGIETSGIYKLLNTVTIHRSITKMLDLQNKSFTEQSFLGSGYIYDFLLTLKKNFRLDESQKNDFSINKIKPAIDFMNIHLSDPIGIDDISKSMNISAQHFCLIFKSIMNQRPFEYLNSLRINHSKNLLLHRPECSIKEIAILSGFSNQSYYCSKFKQRERVSPVNFRQLYKQDN
ncbi:MAG: AraC family transcriptional regulator [Spirochaetaceae bacterium]